MDHLYAMVSESWRHKKTLTSKKNDDEAQQATAKPTSTGLEGKKKDDKGKAKEVVAIPLEQVAEGSHTAPVPPTALPSSHGSTSSTVRELSDFYKPADYAERRLKGWLGDGVLFATLGANELGAMAGGPMIKAEPEPDGADERVERGRTQGREGVLRDEHAELAESTATPRELEEGREGGPDSAGPRRRRVFDLTKREYEQAVVAEREAGARRGAADVDAVYDNLSAIARAGWDDAADVWLRTSRNWPYVVGAVRRIREHGCDPRLLCYDLGGLVYWLGKVIYCLVDTFFRSLWDFRRIILVAIAFYVVLLKVYHVDAVKLAIGILKAAPGWIEKKFE